MTGKKAPALCLLSVNVRDHAEGLPRAGLCPGFLTRPAKKLAKAWLCAFSPPDVARASLPRLASLSCGRAGVISEGP